MEIGKPIRKVQEFLKKYKYAILVLLLGFVIMVLPINSKTQKTQNYTTGTESETEIPLEERLSEILSKVEGVGEVRVLLTVAAGEETLYQVDRDVSDGDSSKTDTVTITDGERNQKGMVRQVNPVTYQGAIVVCKGADDLRVQLAVVDAVSKTTGLGANKISVLKMY